MWMGKYEDREDKKSNGKMIVKKEAADKFAKFVQNSLRKLSHVRNNRKSDGWLFTIA